MKLYGIWHIEDEILMHYSYDWNKYFGNEEEIKNELGWLDCDYDGSTDMYIQVAILDTETGLIKLEDIGCVFSEEV